MLATPSATDDTILRPTLAKSTKKLKVALELCIVLHKINASTKYETILLNFQKKRMKFKREKNMKEIVCAARIPFYM